MVLAAARNIPQVPFSGLASHKKLAHYNHPDVLPWLGLYSGKPRGVRCHESTGATAAPCWLPKTATEIGGLAACHSKVIKEARLVKRKVCSMLDTGNQGGEGVGQMPVQRPHPPPIDNQWEGAFIGRGRGLHAEIAQSALKVILKLIISGLISVILIVLSTVNL